MILSGTFDVRLSSAHHVMITDTVPHSAQSRLSHVVPNIRETQRETKQESVVDSWWYVISAEKCVHVAAVVSNLPGSSTSAPS